MKDFRIEDIIRYLVTGIWIFFLLNQNHILPEIFKFDKDKEFIVIIISFSIGAVAYSIFRTLFYPIVQRGLDLIISPNTGRKYIKKQFKMIKKWKTRNDLWVLFHQKYPERFPGHYTIWLSSFLTIYTLSMSTLVAAIFSDYHMHYIVIGIVLLGVGIVSNINYELRFFNNTLMISCPTFKEFVQEYLTNKSKLLEN